MQNINTEELNRLLSIIQDAPMQRMGHFTDTQTNLSDELSQVAQAREYQYLINCTDEQLFDSLKSTFTKHNSTKVQHFNIARKSYMQHGLPFDYLFVTLVIPDEQKEIFLKKAHKAIKNAGLIIMFTNDIISEQEKWYELLEKCYFVATNTINIENGLDVIISKKMHGWGG